VNPKSVASIILGGGAGTRLFPLTGRRAKPAVLYDFEFELLVTVAIIANSLCKVYVFE